MRDEFVNDTLVIVVTYNPDWRLVFDNVISNIKSYDIFISDNSDSSIGALDLDKLVGKEKHRIFYHYNGGNVGIAAAQNVAIVFATSKCYDCVFFSDDDSSFNDEIIAKLITALTDLRSLGRKLAAVCATPLERGGMDRAVPINERFYSVKNLMSSGSLSPLCAFSKVGLFDERLFIDYVDYDWGWRSLNMGYELILDSSVLFSHRLGIGKLDLPFFMRLGVPSPIRHFYQTRNLLKLSMSSYAPLSWKLLQIMLLPIRFLIFGFLYRDSKERRKQFVRGFWDVFSK